MRVGIVLFVIPFLFVLQPELILVGEPLDVAWAAITAIVAMMTLASVLENYLYGFGTMAFGPRALLLIATGCLLVPGKISDLVGIAGLIVVFALSLLIRRATKEATNELSGTKSAFIRNVDKEKNYEH